MQTVHSINELNSAIIALKAEGRRIGFVPTMGNLHRGHLRLVEAAHSDCDAVVVSIFVNPMQFGENEDLDKYPRTLEADQEKLSAYGTSLLFAPSAREMYPNGMDKHLKINMPHMAGALCGKSRPTHFEGVCTVVTKLFNLVKPDLAVFGKKDLQQLMVIKQMTLDLCLKIDILGVETEREENGLAMSSRNSLLSDTERQEALIISKTLNNMKDAIINGNTAYTALVDKGIATINQSLLTTDYLEIRELVNFELAQDNKTYAALGLFAAAYAEKTRLIDNVTIGDT